MLADFLGLNAADDKEIVADYDSGCNCTCATKPASGHTERCVRAGQSMRSGCKRACAYNLQFAAPLDENEVKGIAKSIAKCTMHNSTESEFKKYVKETHGSEIQKLRGATRGRAGGRLSKVGGYPNSTGTPWVDMNISRSSWYRKYKNKRW